MKVLIAFACGAVIVYFLFLAYWSYRVGKKMKSDMSKRDKEQSEFSRKFYQDFRADMDKRAKERSESRRKLNQMLGGVRVSSSPRSTVGSTRSTSSDRDNGSDALVLASVLSASESGSSDSYTGGYSSGCYGSSSSSSDSSSSSCSSD